MSRYLERKPGSLPGMHLSLGVSERASLHLDLGSSLALPFPRPGTSHLTLSTPHLSIAGGPDSMNRSASKLRKYPSSASQGPRYQGMA